MPHKNDGTACPISNGGNLFQHRSDFICTVDIHILADATLDRIEDHQPRTRFCDRFFNSLIRQRKRIAVLHNVENHILICTGVDQSRLDGVAQTVLRRLVDHMKWLGHLHAKDRFARRTRCGKAQGKCCFAFARIALNDCELAEGYVRFP